MPSEPVSESGVLRRDQLIALIAAAVVLVAVALVIGSLVNGPSAVRRAPESSVSELTTTAATATTTTTMPAATAVGTLPATTARATVIPTISPVQRQLVTTTTADFHLANSGGVTDDSFMGAFEIFFRRYGLDERREICDAMAARGWTLDADMKRYGEGPNLDVARLTYSYRYACAYWLHLPQLRPVSG